MKELQFKTGGRRIRIEDIEALQEGIIGSNAFLGASGQNFVVTGVVPTLTKAVGNPGYNHNFGGNYYTLLQFAISEGYVWLAGKLRKVAATNITCTPTNSQLYIVPKDTVIGNQIIYFDGSTGQQFYDYGAEIIASSAMPEGEYIGLTSTLNYTYATQVNVRFTDYKTGYLSVLAMPKSGGLFDENAKTTWYSGEDGADGSSHVSVDPQNGVELFCKTDSSTANKLTLSAEGISVWGKNGSQQSSVHINMEQIEAPTILSEKLSSILTDDSCDVDDIISFFKTLSHQNILFGQDNLHVTWGKDDDGDEVYTHVAPGEIIIRRDDDSALITDKEINIENVDCQYIVTGYDEEGHKVYTPVNDFLTKNDNGVNANIVIGTKILKIKDGIIVEYSDIDDTLILNPESSKS